MDERVVARRVRLDLAVATVGWLLPWGAWAAGDGAILGVAAAVAAAFLATPLAGVATALLACILQWGAAGSAGFVRELSGLLAGRPVDPHLYTDLWQAGLWLFVGWRAAVAAARPPSRDGVETEGRRGLLGWFGVGALSAVAPASILVPAFVGLLAFAGGELDALAHTHLHEFELRFGELRGHRSFTAATRLSLGAIAAAAVLAGWIIGGGGGILGRALELLGRALSYALSPVFLALGYIAEFLLAIIKWLLHGKKLKFHQLATMTAAPKRQHPLPPSHAPVWAVLTGRWLLALAVIAVLVVGLGLLRARRRERPEAMAMAEERESLPPEAGDVPPPRRRGRRSLDPDGAVRRLFRRWLALAGEHGSPRRAQETAAEHFRRVLPGGVRDRAADLLLTYQRARYGQRTSPGAQQAAEAALERIRKEWR